MANLEREYKFGLPNNWSHFTLTNFDLVRGHVIDIQRFEMQSEDYDTASNTLTNGGHSFRRRTENDKPVYTLKVLRDDNGQGKRERTEYEVDDDCSLNEAVTQIYQKCIAAGDKKGRDIIEYASAPIVDANHIFATKLYKFRTRSFVRYEYTIDFRDATLAIAVDVGIKITKEGMPAEETTRIRKIDLEYKDGNVETFEKYVQAFEFCTGLRRITEASVTDLNYDL